MIAIIDYGLGNIKNIERALLHLGYDAILTSDEETIKIVHMSFFLVSGTSKML